MKIVEAMEEVNDGNVTTRISWFPNMVVMSSSETGKIFVYNTCTNEEIDYLFTANDVQADDWIIKQFRRPLTFIEAFKEIKNDKKVRRKVWEDGTYIDGNTRLYSLIPSEFLCNDWEVVE
ncbi:MAG TPA: hypothetical protein PKL04_01010 [Methanofastidiosum sp.]|nr:hypothetical protein [Methanofastidiosum sp.]